METKHTKGEWKVNDWELENSKGCEIKADWGTICTIPYFTSNYLANAKLIAAAPDLLAALRQYVNSTIEEALQDAWYEKYKNDNTADKTLIASIYAIKKATT